MLLAAAHGDAKHRRLRRGRRGNVAKRDKGRFHRLDVGAKPRPACGRAPDLRRVADRLQRRTESERSGSPVGGAATAAAAVASPGAAPTNATDPTRFPAPDALAQQRQRLLAADARCERAKIGFARERVFEQAVIAPFRYLNCAQGAQMLCNVLRIEQPVTAGAQPRDQMHQRDFRGVAGAVKHALPEEGAAKRYAVESADERRAVIALDRL